MILVLPNRAVAVRPYRLRARIIAIYAALLIFNLGAWAFAIVVFRRQPIFLGTALLAYGFGLRHAVDADHIAAIDNATRKLVNEGQRPAAVGLWFAAGHSTMVVLAVAVLAAIAGTVGGRAGALQTSGRI